jgi:hypothetical protein
MTNVSPPIGDVTPPAPVPPAAAPVVPRAANTLGLVALILALVGFVLGVVPATAGFAWILLLPAFILAIVGMTRKGKSKTTSTIALIVSIIGWIISIIVFFVSAAVGIDHAIKTAPEASKPDQSSTGSATTPPAPAKAGIGDTVTSRDGVAVTVSAVTCGLATAGDSFLTDTAKGQFCQVNVNISNGTSKSVNVSSFDFSGFIGDSKYETSSIANSYGGDSFSTDLNPGLAADSTLFFDIPAGAVLDTFQYQTFITTDSSVVIALH